jgi:hypothetical protein
MARKPAPVVQTEAVEPENAWADSLAGDVYVDAAGKEHHIIGVVHEGFDSVCDGKVEHFREYTVREDPHPTFPTDPTKYVRVEVPVDEETYNAVSAWTRKGA